MASSNPFEEDSQRNGNCEVNVDTAESQLGEGIDCKIKNHLVVASPLPAHMERASIDMIASRLLEDNYVLTALELHTELTESGRECKRLRDYFSNPINFEPNYSDNNVLPSDNALNRTSSNQTLDSLDFARYSDDASNVADDPSAVLEFELRKARDTIKNLREQLTTASEQGLPSMESSISMPRSESVVTVTAEALPHEKRALNFLVHEYLLHAGCRLTAVSLSDEIVDQDIDDWDDVGLNVSRPQDLLAIFREFARQNLIVGPGISCETQTEFETPADPHHIQDFPDVSILISRLNEENSQLLEVNSALENDINRLKNDVMRLEKLIKEPGNTQSPSEIRRIQELKEKRSHFPTQETDQSLGREECSRRPPPKKLCDKVESIVLKKRSDHDLLDLEIEKPPENFDQIIEHLAVSLPNVIPHILLNKREEVIPLLISVCLYHKDASVRDKLINILFNLVKKPEDEQRHRILLGCVSFTRLAGPLRTETELLPQCWEQINHKHTERRLLVAETCGALAPLLPPRLLSSLLVSILQQMILSDKSDRVRLAVVHSMANLCLFINDKDKFAMLNDLTQKCVLDSSQIVAEESRHILLPCLAVWAEEIGKLQLGIVSVFALKTLQVLQTSGVSQQANSSVLCAYLECLQSVIPSLFWSILRSSPFVESSTSDLECIASELKITRFPSMEGFASSVIGLSNSRDHIEVLTAAFDRHTDKEWFKSWDCLDFVIKEYLPQVLNIVKLVEIDLQRVLVQLITFVRTLTQTFGKGIAEYKIKPAFEEAINLGPTTASFPVYVIGVLSAFSSPASWNEIRKLMRSRFLNIEGPNTHQFIHCNTLTWKFLLKENWLKHEDLLSLAYELVPHMNGSVRSGCASLLCASVSAVNQDLLKSKVLPALVTLSSDQNVNVRSCTFEGFRAVMELGSQDEQVKDKVRMQLNTLFEDENGKVLGNLVNCLARSASSLQDSFRNDFIIPQLACVSARLTQSAPQARDVDLINALFTAFSAISVCYMPAQVLHDAFIPGLRALLLTADAEHSKVLQSILKESEHKLIEQGGSHERSLSDMNLGDEIGAKMLNKLKDFKGKMDFHKDSMQYMFKKK